MYVQISNFSILLFNDVELFILSTSMSAAVTDAGFSLLYINALLDTQLERHDITVDLSIAVNYKLLSIWEMMHSSLIILLGKCGYNIEQHKAAVERKWYRNIYYVDIGNKPFSFLIYWYIIYYLYD